MTTIDRLIEISRQALKALLAEYQAASNRDDALYALSALREIEKIGPLKVAIPTLCGVGYKGALSGHAYECQEARGHYPATKHSCGTLTWGSVGSGLVEGVPNLMTDTSTRKVHAKIKCIVTMQAWRGTRTALFEGPDRLWLCQVWFEGGQPFLQIRGNKTTPLEAALVEIAISMALDWITKEMSNVALEAYDPLPSDEDSGEPDNWAGLLCEEAGNSGSAE